MRRTPVGSFAQATFDAIRRAEQMQVLALAYGHSQFEAKPELESIEDLTWDTFLETLSNIKTDEELAAYNAKLATLIAPFIQMAMQPEQPQ